MYPRPEDVIADITEASFDEIKISMTWLRGLRPSEKSLFMHNLYLLGYHTSNKAFAEQGIFSKLPTSPMPS